MVGSLVATLPSEFTGGALEVEHNGSVTTYRGSKKAISLVAFYSDCRHQVRTVRSGYRIVLTYHLSLRGEPATDPGISEDPALMDELAHHLDGHFSQSESPSRLVYLLDHEYTARGLSWSSLKGDDALRASTLRLAAGHVLAARSPWLWLTSTRCGARTSPTSAIPRSVPGSCSARGG